MDDIEDNYNKALAAYHAQVTPCNPFSALAQPLGQSSKDSIIVSYLQSAKEVLESGRNPKLALGFINEIIGALTATKEM